MTRFIRLFVSTVMWLILLASFACVGRSRPALAAGNIYYVATTGNDANPGTAAFPWRTIQKAANTLVAGDTVYIRTGVFPERVQPQNSGTAGAYITYAADVGAVVTIDGTGISTPNGLDGLFGVSGKSYLKISNLRITNSQGAGIRVDGSNNIVVERNYTYNTVSSGIGVWNSSAITVDGNEIVLANNDGSQENLTIGVTNSFQVRNNSIHDGGPGTHGGESLGIKDGSSNGLVYGNQVYHNTRRLGILVDAWDKHEYNIQIFQNRVHDNTDYGISIGSEAGGLLENVQVYNNLIYANLGYGVTIRPDGISTYHPVKDLYIINNVLYGNNGGGWGGGIYLINPDVVDVILRNNIVSQNFSFQIVIGSNVPAGQVIIDHNLIDGYRGYANEVYGTSYVTGNPWFYYPVTADFHLQPGSPAIDKGSAVGAPSTDFDGIPRPQAGTSGGIALFDIGAYEFVPWVVKQRIYLPLIEKLTSH